MAQKTVPGSIAIPVSVAGLLIAYASMPYGYYMIMRCLICGVSIYLALASYSRIKNEMQRNGVCIGLTICAILYNPIFRVHLDRESWQGINAATIIGLLVVFGILRATRPAAESPSQQSHDTDKH